MIDWTIQDDGSIISPYGTKVAQLRGTTIYLYDKKVRVGLPLTPADLTRLTADLQSMNSEPVSHEQCQATHRTP